MTLLVVRAHKRFAVRRTVEVARTSSAGKPVSGLMIELSSEGCRISSINQQQFECGQDVDLRIEGFQPIEACVRWFHDGCAGLRFTRAVGSSQLDAMLARCRPNSNEASQRKYA